MKLNLIKSIDKNYDVIVAFTYENDRESLKKYFSGEMFLIDKVLEKKEFKGKKTEKAIITLAVNGHLTELIVVGLGKKEKIDNYELRRTVYSTLQGLKGKEFLVIADEVDSSQALAETILISEYKFDKYKSKKKDDKEDVEKNFDFIGNIEVEALVEAKVLNDAIVITRDLVNEPSNVIYPETLAIEAKNNGDKYGFEVPHCQVNCNFSPQ